MSGPVIEQHIQPRQKLTEHVKIGVFGHDDKASFTRSERGEGIADQLGPVERSCQHAASAGNHPRRVAGQLTSPSPIRFHWKPALSRDRYGTASRRSASARVVSPDDPDRAAKQHAEAVAQCPQSPAKH